MVHSLAYRTLTVYGRLSHVVQLKCTNQMLRSYNPALAVTNPVWANPRSLATTWGITCCFLFLRVLRCFSSPGLPSGQAAANLYSSNRGVAPFGNLGISEILAVKQLDLLCST